MREDLIKIDTLDMPREMWLQERMNSIGGSTMAAILGLNEYVPAIVAFNQFIGKAPQMQSMNMPMILGTEMEPVVLNLWKYWDGTQKGMMDNYNNKKQAQECRPMNAIIRNPDFAHFHANCDSEMIRNYKGRKGHVEAKTAKSISFKKYKSGIPEAYVIQNMVYMMVLETDYAEMPVLFKDTDTYDVIPFERDEALCQIILERSKDFWDKVLVGREVIHSDLTDHQKEALLQQIEPEPDSTDALEKYFREEFKANNELPTLECSQAIWELLVELKTEVEPRAEELAKREQFIRNVVINELREHTVLDLGSSGQVTYRADKNGKRTLRFNKLNF